MLIKRRGQGIYIGGISLADACAEKRSEKADDDPGKMENRKLKATLCKDVKCAGCEVMCGFGKEYLKRKADGRI